MKSLLTKTTVVTIIVFCLCFTQVFAGDEIIEPGSGTNYYNQQELDKQDKNATQVNADGSVKYSYPMGPVSLDYSSNSGWTLGGFSAITVSTNNGVPRYNGSETFLLDGEELVQVGQQSSQYEYRTKRDSMKKIYRITYVDTQTNKTVSKWEVHNPDGGVSYYDEQVFAPDRASGKIRKWMISKSLDRGAYNVVYYRYIQVDGEAYPTSITSGKNITNGTYKTTFITYEEGGYGLNYSYIYGSLVVENKQRPANVFNYLYTDEDGTGGSSAVCAGGYRITYTSDETNHAVVESITQLGSDMTSTLPSVTFDYYDFNLTFSSTAEQWTISGDTSALRQNAEDNGGNKLHAQADFIDMNGDGLLDRVSKNRSSTNMYVRLNNGSGFNAAVQWTTSDSSFLRDINISKGLYPYGMYTGPGTYDYQKWTHMRSQGVLMDIDGDGLPDRITTSGNNLYVRLNDGTQFYSVPNWTNPHGDTGMDYSKWYYKESTYFWEDDKGVVHANTPIVLSNETETYYTTVDMNGDGIPDRAVRDNNKIKVFHNSGAAFDATGVTYEGLDFGNGGGLRHTFAGGHTYIDLLDINGDGLYDSVIKNPGQYDNKLRAKMNMGYAFQSAAVMYGSTDNKYLRDQENTLNDYWDYIDMNCDGRPDRVSKTYGDNPTALNVWLNGGISPIDYQSAHFGSMIAATLTDTHSLRSGRDFGAITDYMDMNGDGLPDRVKKDQNNQTLYIWFNTSGENGNPAGKLKEVRNGKGGTTTYTYKLLNKTWNPSVKPSMWVIDGVTESDGLGSSFTTSYDYSSGVYDFKGKEFMGFGEIRKTEPTGDYTLTGYNTDEYLKGYVNYVKTYTTNNDNGILFEQINYDYDIFHPSDRHLSFPYEIVLIKPAYVKTSSFDGVANPSNARSILDAYIYEFDANGCISKTTKTNYGEVNTSDWSDIGTDKSRVSTTYVNDASSKWVLGLEQMTDTWGFEGNTGVFQRQTAAKNAYDTNYNLTRTERWNGSATADLTLNSTSWVNPTVYQYDTYGNVTRKTEPEGVANGGYYTQTVYDLAFHSYPTSTSNALGHTTTITYDSLMRPITVLDFNNNIAQNTRYDIFGRIAKKWGPLGTEWQFSERIFHTDAQVNTDGSISVPAYIATESAQTPESGISNLYATTELYDGLGRVIQTKSRYNCGSNNVGWLTADKYYGYDGSKTFSKTSIPYITPAFDWSSRDTSKPCTTVESWLDSNNGKVSTTINTDNTVVTTYDRLWVTTTTDAKGIQKQVKRNGQGRTVEVVETDGVSSTISTTPANNIYTRYEYKSGTGAQIKLTDTADNTTTTNYNMLGQVTQTIDPDAGTTQYTYNANSAVTQKTTANGAVIGYVYDNMGRNTRINYPNGSGGQLNYDIFYYDSYTGYDYTKTDMRTGKLLAVKTYRNGTTQMEDRYYYDYYGNMKEKRRSILNTGSTMDAVTEKFQYDLLGRVVKSDIDGEDIEYKYNEIGKVKRVLGIDNFSDSSSKYGTNTSVNSTEYTALYDTTGLIPKFSYNNYTLRGNGGYWRNFVDRTDTDTICNIDITGRNLAYVYQGLRTYPTTEQVTDNWVSVLVHAGANTANVSIDDFKLVFTGGAISLNTAIAQGYIEPLVIMDCYHDNNAWQNPTILADGTSSTEIRSNPYLYVTFKVKDKAAFTGAQFYANRDFNNTSDGMMIYKYAPEYDISLCNLNSYVSDTNYTDFGAISNMTYNNTYTTTYAYYNTGTTPSYRLKSIQGPAGTNFKNTLTYDNNGNVTAIQDYATANNQAFAYDKLNRLTSATGVYGTQTYTYNDLGNIIQNGTYGTLTYNTTKPHAVIEDPLYTYQYDNAGNLTRKAAKSGGDVWTYAYDWSNNLIEVKKNNVTIMTALYDPSGSRIRKTENGATDYYFSQYVEKTDGAGYRHNYFVGGKRVASRDMNSDTVTYCFQDHLGSVCRVINKDATLMNQYRYAPYGKVAQESVQLAGKYKYNDKELDETGLYYYGARYYDPSIGRFISADTVTPGDGFSSQGLNRYAYCMNNPVKYIDPDGHAGMEPDYNALFKSTIIQTWNNFANYMLDIGARALGGERFTDSSGVTRCGDITTIYFDSVSTSAYNKFDFKNHTLHSGVGAGGAHVTVESKLYNRSFFSDQLKTDITAIGKLFKADGKAESKLGMDGLHLGFGGGASELSGKIGVGIELFGYKFSAGLEGFFGGAAANGEFHFSESGIESKGKLGLLYGGGYYFNLQFPTLGSSGSSGISSQSGTGYNYPVKTMVTDLYAPDIGSSSVNIPYKLN